MSLTSNSRPQGKELARKCRDQVHGPLATRMKKLCQPFRGYHTLSNYAMRSHHLHQEIDCAKQDPEGARKVSEMNSKQGGRKAVYDKSADCLEGIVGVASSQDEYEE